MRVTILALGSALAGCGDEVVHGTTDGGATGGSSGAGGAGAGGETGKGGAGGSFAGGGAGGAGGTNATGGMNSGGSKASGGSNAGGSNAGGTNAGGTNAGGTNATGGAHSTGGASTGGSPAATCTTPVFTTSDTNGGWTDGKYYVHNNMWNDNVTLGPETLYACSHDSWYVVSNQTNEAGAVKTYPNVHQDFDGEPISSFTTITSTFSATSPHAGIYNVAYDIWTNGVATSGSTELMIWTENFNQVPAGSLATNVTFGAHTYDVWKTSNNRYIAFVPRAVITSGTLDLLELMQWTLSKGWLPENSTLGQICFGIEIVSTAGSDARFDVTDFSITSN